MNLKFSKVREKLSHMREQGWSLRCGVTRLCGPMRGGAAGGERREREGGSSVHCRSTVGSRHRLVARELRGVIESASGCIGFRGAGNSGPEAGFDRVNVHNR